MNLDEIITIKGDATLKTKTIFLQSAGFHCFNSLGKVQNAYYVWNEKDTTKAIVYLTDYRLHLLLSSAVIHLSYYRNIKTA